jgi:hypothetical protein
MAESQTRKERMNLNLGGRERGKIQKDEQKIRTEVYTPEKGEVI